MVFSRVHEIIITKPGQVRMFHIILKGIDESRFTAATLSQKKNIYGFSIYFYFLFWLILVNLFDRHYYLINI